jgi:hypothetical protein
MSKLLDDMFQGLERIDDLPVAKTRPEDMMGLPKKRTKKAGEYPDWLQEMVDKLPPGISAVNPRIKTKYSYDPNMNNYSALPPDPNVKVCPLCGKGMKIVSRGHIAGKLCKYYLNSRIEDHARKIEKEEMLGKGLIPYYMDSSLNQYAGLFESRPHTGTWVQPWLAAFLKAFTQEWIIMERIRLLDACVENGGKITDEMQTILAILKLTDKK